MSKNERYDIVIIGAGHNGTTAAAYLAKCGLSVCVLEERPECGGGSENTEPIAGVRIPPHAVGNFAGPGPGWEQLELWKYGFRQDWLSQRGAMMMGEGGIMTSEGLVPATEKDVMGAAKLAGMLTQPPFTKEICRSIFWTPPHPPEVELTEETIPYMQVYKQRAPDIWTKELLEMTLDELMDEYYETEPFKTSMGWGAWLGSGFPSHFEGVAIPSLAGLWAIGFTAGGYVPQGNMHDYFHAIFRCAVAHGAIFRTCCPVDEIIIREGRAVGVRLRDNAACGEKTIWAEKAVLSANHIKQTFLEMIGPQHLDAGFIQRIEDLSLKGGSLWQSHILTREPLRYRAKFQGAWGAGYPMDSREIMYENVADVLSRQCSPTVPPERLIWSLAEGSRMHSPWNSQCTRPDRYLEASFCVYVTTPEYHVDGPDAMDKEKEKWNAYMRQAFSQVFENLDSDNIVYHWANTPYEEELRNTGMLGGSWYGIRECRDQWWNERPLPELARYRVPGIEGLYLSHQSSAHPGGLCLMAIPYNLMHILIEDGIAEPGDWWYPSPWYIPERGKKSAIPR